MMVMLFVLASFFSILIIFNEVVESKPLVGSSQRSKLGSVISSYPILVLFLSPPEIPLTRTPPILVYAQFYRPSL